MLKPSRTITHPDSENLSESTLEPKEKFIGNFIYMQNNLGLVCCGDCDERSLS